MLFNYCLRSSVVLFSQILPITWSATEPLARCDSAPQKQQGFSLFEVLGVLFILTLLAHFTWHSAAANFFRVSSFEQASKAQKQLAEGLLLARQYAVQSQQSIDLCGGIADLVVPSSLTQTHVNEVECLGDWSLGWFITQDSVKRQHTFQTDTVVRWSGFPQNKSYIRFHANGHTDYQNGTFIVCFDGWSSRITLNQSGRFYLDKVKQTTDLVSTAC